MRSLFRPERACPTQSVLEENRKHFCSKSLHRRKPLARRPQSLGALTMLTGLRRDGHRDSVQTRR